VPLNKISVNLFTKDHLLLFHQNDLFTKDHLSLFHQNDLFTKDHLLLFQQKYNVDLTLYILLTKQL